MVSVAFGTDTAKFEGAGMSVTDLLAKMRDGGLEGIHQRLEVDEQLEVLINGVSALAEQVLVDGDQVNIQKPHAQGLR